MSNDYLQVLTERLEAKLCNAEETLRDVTEEVADMLADCGWLEDTDEATRLEWALDSAQERLAEARGFAERLREKAYED